MRAYIRSAAAITSQNTFRSDELFSKVINHEDLRINAVEPDYRQHLDPKAIRRMSRIVKMGLTTALDALKQVGLDQPDAIITGTAYGCLEDTGVFLRGMVGQQEQDLSPTAFIQSTHNTVGAQIALNLKCHNYNNTFVHKGFSFENALTDSLLLLAEGKSQQILTGAIDELTDDSFTILRRFHQHKIGEGAAFFVLSGAQQSGDVAALEALQTIYNPKDAGELRGKILQFLANNALNSAEVDLVLTAKNGDEQNDAFIDQYTEGLFQQSHMFGYKNLFGDYPTVSAPALWLGTMILQKQKVPGAASVDKPIKKLLIINQYKNKYFSLMLLSAL